MKEDIVYVEHVLGCITRIEGYTAGRKSVFIESTLVQDAVVRNLQFGRGFIVLSAMGRHMAASLQQAVHALRDG